MQDDIVKNKVYLDKIVKSPYRDFLVSNANYHINRNLYDILINKEKSKFCIKEKFAFSKSKEEAK
jgi:hypothetical protein